MLFLYGVIGYFVVQRGISTLSVGDATTLSLIVTSGFQVLLCGIFAASLLPKRKKRKRAHDRTIPRDRQPLPNGFVLCYPSNENWLNGRQLSLPLANKHYLWSGGLLLLWLTFLLFINYYYISRLVELYALASRGQSTLGLISEAGCQKYVSKGTTYYLDYRYSFDGIKFYNGIYNTSSEICYATAVKTTVIISYLPDQPEISKPAQMVSDNSDQSLDRYPFDNVEYINKQAILIFGILSEMIILMVCCFYFLHGQQDQYLADEGQILIGVIQSCYKSVLKDFETINFHYEFTYPDGRFVAKEITFSEPKSWDHMPAYGTPILILWAEPDLHQVL